MPERTSPGTSSVAEYVALFQQLLPRGKAWLIQPGTRTARWLDGLMVEAVRVHDFLSNLVDDYDPSTASGELLEAWERSVGLPEPGEELAATTAERRLDVVARIAAANVRTEADWVALAEAAGYAGASVTQGSETMCTCDSLCTAYVQGEHMDAFSFTLNLPGGTPNAQFEALCRRIVHAGVHVYFDYS
jgi:uncharacterized protein YmfQ (DUF2313 family)